jgi:trk system potassium uptake protein
MSRQFVIIGLGQLGIAMLDTLLSLDHEVLGIDLDEDVIQELSGEYPRAHLVTADATEESVLRDLNAAHFVVSRALSKLYGRVLQKIGADRVIEPEREMGAQLARTISSPVVIDYVELGGDEALIEAEVPKEWVGKSLADLHLSRESGLTILALKPRGKSGTIPSGDTVLEEGDVIVVGGTKEALDRSPLVRSEGR